LRLSSGLPRRLLRPSPTTWYLYSFFFFFLLFEVFYSVQYDPTVVR
jgi:hypothetical protein